MTKEYTCECGKTFTSPSSVGGHKRHCKAHLSSIDKIELMEVADRMCAINSAAATRERAKAIKTAILDRWIEEQHKCEKCGKIMTKKFGSGRFCSSRCSNSHVVSNESRIKVSETLRGRPLTEEEKKELLTSKVKREVEKYTGPELPHIEKEDLNPRYFPRTRMSYAEKFWKQVLDNNHVIYEHDYVVQKPKGELGVFRLDFLVGNVDIEIDGSQHYDKGAIKEKDVRRDSYLQSQGFVVYRIRWVNPTNDRNKLIVNKQIEDLFHFINVERIC